METSPRTTESLILGLVNDVVYEILLHFVAIDWNGPFTLILVNATWRDVVISKPRLWTWIMVDDTEPDWRPRIDVGAHLSRNLPLQIVLRVPFSSEVSMTELTSRCATLIFETPSSHGAGSLKYRNQYIGDSLSLFLKDVPKQPIRVLDGDRTQKSFHYANDETYDAAYDEIK